MDRNAKLTIVSILVAILIFGGQMGWEFYKNRVGLEVQVVDVSSIIDKSKRPDGLEVTYKGEKIEALARASFRIVNTGSTAIHNKDIVSPLFIQLSKTPDNWQGFMISPGGKVTQHEGTEIIDAKIDEKKPPEIEATVKVDRADGKVSVEFSLLNPGESITVGILMRASNAAFVTGARITGISEIPLIELSEMRRRNPPAVIYWFARGVTLLMGVVMVMYSFLIFSDLKARYRARAKLLTIPAGTRDDVVASLRSQLWHFDKEDIAKLRAELEVVPDSPDYGAVNQEFIYRMTELAVNRHYRIVAAIIIVGIAVAMIYVSWRLWT